MAKKGYHVTPRRRLHLARLRNDRRRRRQLGIVPDWFHPASYGAQMMNITPVRHPVDEWWRLPTPPVDDIVHRLETGPWYVADVDAYRDDPRPA